MATPHINAEPGDFAKVVLMPGDPLRAKWFAETFLSDYKQVNTVRNMLAYTGYTKSGKRLSVMASGMGMASISIYSYELFKYYDVDVIIRVGTTGAYLEHIKLGDVLIVREALTDSNFGRHYNIESDTLASDPILVEEAIRSAKESNSPYQVGTILSTDIFYDKDKDKWKTYAARGVMGVEMESYALFVSAIMRKKKALCLLEVTDHFVTGEKMSSIERQTGLTSMMELAIKIAEKYC